MPMRILLAAIVIAIFAAYGAAAQPHGHGPGHGETHRSGGGAETGHQIEAVRRGVERYRDFAVAEREGWRLFGGEEPLMGGHWYPPDGRDYVHGDELDFTRPNNLIYATIDGRRVLTGVAFVVRLGPGEPVPEGFAGSEDRWHVHDFVAAIEAALGERPILNWLANWWLDEAYRNRGDNRARLAMVHVWVTEPNPDGVFADYHRVLPYIQLGLPRAYAQGASLAAARGLHLATEHGCAEAVDGRLWIANASRQQTRTINAACAAARRDLNPVLASDAPTINIEAERVWTRLDLLMQETLSLEQRRRIAAMTEHGEHTH
jgi:hypothetical protein